jgi:nucleotide-binding universal stress UspA family protein
MKFLVAVDLSQSTEMIVDKVKEITRGCPADVWILHNALPEPGHIEFKVDPIEARKNLAEKFHNEHREIQDIAEQLRKSGLDSKALLVHGETVETILKEAADLDVDMIVVGTHGRGAMHQLIMGSISEEIIHKSRCPVLVIPTHERT